MSERASGLVTLLFTDLVGSTELLSRTGDEEAQRVFRAHHDLLAETVAAHGGHEVKWLGDGLMVAFPSAADAVSCAIEMQRASRRPVEGQRLDIRVGLNAGEALRDVGDYFGTPVVVARRLCDRAQGGQILCTETVAGLLAGRSEFSFSELGKLDLKGVPEAVSACDVRYEATSVHALPIQIPMVGREPEFGRLTDRLADAVAGRGGLAVMTGEPGIGKTRMLEELAERARHQGVLVLFGRCLESDWAPPYAPFAEALAAHVVTVEPRDLRVDLGPGAGPIAQLVPAVRQVLPDVPDPVSVQPDEERFRLIDSVAQFLLARSQRAPLLVCLDDLHWADKGTVAMFRHVARFALRYRLLVLGAYREADVDRSHPLNDALGALRRETEYEDLKLDGLGAKGVNDLLEALAQHELPEKVGAAWAQETGGNPFFIRELVRHLAEEEKLDRDREGRWTTVRPIRELSLPKSVRDVLSRRLSRLSEEANMLLGVGAAFEGTFRFGVVAGVAGLDELAALDALDEALAADIIRSAGTSEVYTFATTLTRQAVYDRLSPARQARLHRRVAEALGAAYGTRPTLEQAGEIASQYHRSAELPGAEGGVEPALVAADHAQATGAHDEAAGFLRMALDMLPEDDERRPRLLGRLGVVLAWALAFDEGVAVAAQAGDAIAQAEDKRAAAEYLSDAAYVCALAGGIVPSWELARTGLTYAGARDVAWARLICFDYQRREAEDHEHPGVPIDSAERREAARILLEARLDRMGPAPMEAVFDSRQEARQSSNLSVGVFYCGDYAASVPLLEAEAAEAESLGRLARAARCQAFVAMCQAALGRLEDARQALDQTEALAARMGVSVPATLQARESLAVALGEDLEELAGALGPLTASVIPPIAWLLGCLYAYAARIAARIGRAEEALRCLTLLAPWLERAPAWTIGFPLMACHAAETLWVLERVDHHDVIEFALRNKVIAPEFRFPEVDGRLAMARLCALTGRHEEAVSWFAEARRVLTEEGARPLLAIADYDEALMYVRRSEPRDSDRAKPLLDAARHQFEEIGMTGWIRRAEELSG